MNTFYYSIKFKMHGNAYSLYARYLKSTSHMQNYSERVGNCVFKAQIMTQSNGICFWDWKFNCEPDNTL